MKCYQSHPGFELVSPCPFPTTIAITPRAPPKHLLKALIEANPHKTTREVAVEIEVDHSTVVRHLKQIGKSKKLDKWVPHELNDNQKNCHFEVSSTLFLCNKNDPFLQWIVMCDEKWILYDNRRCSAQWLDAGEAPQHFPKPKLHKKKKKKGYGDCLVVCGWSHLSQLLESGRKDYGGEVLPTNLHQPNRKNLVLLKVYL